MDNLQNVNSFIHGQLLKTATQFMGKSNSLRYIFLQFSNHHYNAIIKGENHIIINSDKPTEYDTDKVISETVAVGRDVTVMTGSKYVQASLKKEPEDHPDVIVTTENPDFKSGKSFNMAIYENVLPEVVTKCPQDTYA